MIPPLVLASSSPYRRQLLERLRIPFEAATPDCDETPRAGEGPVALVGRLAEAKARSVAAVRNDALIVGSDQVAALDDTILTKPGTHERAVAQLTACSGRTVVFHTGLALVDGRSGDARVGVVDFPVSFRALSAGEIERYLAAEAPYDCAGSIRSEGYAITLFDAMQGEDPTALVGLPLIRLSMLLREAGLPLP